MSDNNSEEQKSTNRKRPSLDSIQEISQTKERIIRIFLILFNITSLIIGGYILSHRDYYLNPDYNFKNYIFLYLFIITYTLGMILALILSFLVAIIVKVIYFFKNKGHISEKSTIDTNNNLILDEQAHSRISVFVMSNKQNEIALFPFTFSYFLVFTIGLYFISLPYSFFLLINLFRDKTYSNVISFFWLYIFLGINFIAGLMMFISLCYMVCAKRSGSVRKFEYPIDNDNVEKIRNEVAEAINI